MNEQEIQKQLVDINNNLVQIRKNTRINIWRSFFTGTFSALGSVIGAAIALAIIGLVLNAVGVIPAFTEQVNSWKQTIDKLQQTR